MTETDKDLLPDSVGETTAADGTGEKMAAAEEPSEKDLRALAQECETRMDEVADLITRVRHEINNPLTGVLGQTQLLLREDLSQSARRRAEKIEELAIRIRDVVAELRQVQKPTKG